jgi:hypothetical protein
LHPYLLDFRYRNRQRLLADFGLECISPNNGCRLFVESDLAAVLERDADDVPDRDLVSARLAPALA